LFGDSGYEGYGDRQMPAIATRAAINNFSTFRIVNQMLMSDL